MAWIHFISTFLLIKLKLIFFLHRKYQMCHFPSCLHFWQFSALVMSPQSHNNPGSDWRRGRGLILHPQDTGEGGGKRKQHQQVMSRSVWSVDIPLLNLIVNEWLIADRGEDLVTRPAIICLADWKLGNKSSPLASLNLQHFAIYEWAASCGVPS